MAKQTTKRPAAKAGRVPKPAAKAARPPDRDADPALVAVAAYYRGGVRDIRGRTAPLPARAGSSASS